MKSATLRGAHTHPYSHPVGQYVAEIDCIALRGAHTHPYSHPVGQYVAEIDCLCIARRHTDPGLLQGTSVAVILVSMSEVTRILSAIDQGDGHAAEQLLP